MSKNVQNIQGSYFSIDSRNKVNVDLHNTPLVIAAAARTASGNQADSQSLEDANAAIVTVVVNSISGTSPTLAVNSQSAATGAGPFTTDASSASITAAGTYQFITSVGHGSQHRISWTIGGTSPNVNFAVYVTPFKYGQGV